MNIIYRKTIAVDVELLINTRLRLLEEDSATMTDYERDILYQSKKNHTEAGTLMVLLLHATLKGKQLFEHCGFQITDDRGLIYMVYE